MLTGGLTIENPSVELSGIPPAGGSVLVLLGGITSEVEKNGSLELVEVANIQSVNVRIRLVENYDAKVNQEAYQEAALVHEQRVRTLETLRSTRIRTGA